MKSPSIFQKYIAKKTRKREPRKKGLLKGVVHAVSKEVLGGSGLLGSIIHKKLTEVSKDRLGKYVRDAANDINDQSYSLGMDHIEGKNPERAERSEKRVNKRLNGISRATKRLTEDGMGGVGGTPVNNASSGAVAGLGTSRDGSQGEPGVKKGKKSPFLTYNQFKRTVKP